jgi:hypothetical protein
MAEQKPIYDKSFTEATAGLTIEKTDAVTQSITTVARLLGAYRAELIAQGFSSDEAMVLISLLQTKILANVTS